MRPALLSAAGLFCLSLLAPWTGRAADYKYPNAAPVLVITLPDGWKVAPEQPANGQLAQITTPEDPDYAAFLITGPPAVNTAARNAFLTGAANAAAKGAGMTDVKVSEVTEEKMNHGLRTFALIHASGKIRGVDATYVIAGFTMTDGGRYYLVGEAGSNTRLLTHKAQFQKIANSILPVGPSPQP